MKGGAEDMTPTPMTPLQMVIAIVISAVITFSLRALPFVIFHGNRKCQSGSNA